MSDWIHRAACRDVDPDLFFPIGTTGPAALQIAAAKQVCARCPVARACLIASFEQKDTPGVWGGHDEEERKPMRRTWMKANPKWAREGAA